MENQMLDVKYLHPDRLAATYHDESLKKESSICMIWSNGRITITKGGDLFGQRSYHEIASFIPGTDCFTWLSEFPVKVDKTTSYAIVKDTDCAYEIRGSIIDCVCNSLESRKKLRY